MLGDFNARVGRSVQIDDVIGMFGEDMRNASGNRLLSFLNEVELMICNGRKLVSEPEWTRVRRDGQLWIYTRPCIKLRT